MERDGCTARPREFLSRESYRFSRRAFKQLIDTPALTKMIVLLAKNKEMKIHTAAHIAARYTTGACTDSIARRLVKRFPVAASKFYILNVEESDGHQFVDDRISLSHGDSIIFIDMLQLIEDGIEENFLPFLQLSPTTFEILFNNSEAMLSLVFWFYSAIRILRIIRPAISHKIIFGTAEFTED